MADNIFSLQELKWLQAHSKTEEQINEFFEDSLNVDPLDSGEPDLIPYQRALKAAQITIEVAEKKLIAGPYDNLHWQIICKHLSGHPSLINKEKGYKNKSDAKNGVAKKLWDELIAPEYDSPAPSPIPSPLVQIRK